MSIHKYTVGIGVALAAASSLALGTVAPASADPGFTPNATSSANPDVVGVGSDTIEFVLNDLATGYDVGKSDGRLASWNATGTVGESWSPRSGAPTYTRPNGSSAGKAALFGAGNIPAVNFARSSSTLSTAEAAANLQQYPFAVDGLALAVSGNVASNAPDTISSADMLKIYNGTYKHWNEVPGGTSTDAIKPYVPQTGSGTRKFFEAQLAAEKGSAWTASDYGAPSGDYPGVQESQEHDPSVLQNDPDAIAPFSTARQHTLATPSAIKLEDGFLARRAVYDVIRQADQGAAWVGSIFGPTGYLCSSAGKTIIENAGFAQLRSQASGGQCGVATQSPVTTFDTNTITTTTSLTGASNAGHAATLTATVDSGGQVADGEVDFYEGATQVGTGVLSGGQSVVTLTGVTPGSHSYVAKFVSGNTASFSNSQSSATAVTVKESSTTSMTISPATGTYGHSRTANVTVSSAGSPATGTVTVKIDGVARPAATLSGGAASVAIPLTTAAGTHSVVATYNGTATVATSSNTKSLVVAKSPATMTESFPSVVAAGSRARGTITVNLSPTSTIKPTGTVTVKKGTKVYGSGTLSRGAATFTLLALPKGTNTMTMTYGGSSSVNTASKTFTITQR